MNAAVPTLSRDRVVYAIDAAEPPRMIVDAPAEVTIETHDARRSSGATPVIAAR